jgi:hypothetical protein
MLVSSLKDLLKKEILRMKRERFRSFFLKESRSVTFRDLLELLPLRVIESLWQVQRLFLPDQL